MSAGVFYIGVEFVDEACDADYGIFSGDGDAQHALCDVAGLHVDGRVEARVAVYVWYVQSCSRGSDIADDSAQHGQCDWPRSCRVENCRDQLKLFNLFLSLPFGRL